jgi:hypothetical protein
MSLTDISNPNKRKMSEYIRPRPSANAHHAISFAKEIGYPLNLFVSINFSLTACLDEDTDVAFRRLRQFFTKWTSRPHKKVRFHAAPPTFVYSIENQSGVLNTHWLVHVPSPRHDEFSSQLGTWLEKAAGPVYDTLKAIDIQPVTSARSVGKYLLKGNYPSKARDWDIRPEYCGWVTGRRVGHSQNLGPVERERWYVAGRIPRPKHYVINKFNQRQRWSEQPK